MAKSSDTDLVEYIGRFLYRRLGELGVKHIFGVAGDYNLELLEQLEGHDSPRWVGCCNELNAAYAADGYARTAGLGVLMTTYGVGELSALSGVAGAYAEHLPIIAIVGAPPLTKIKRHGLLQHTAGDGNYSNMMACGREFSVAQARITPQNAVSEIDRCLRACMLYKQPVYIQVPSDIVYLKITTPKTPLVVEFHSDVDMVEDFAAAALSQIASAASVAILADADVSRFGHADKVLKLAERLSCPFAVMATAKGLFDETHPNYVGVYSGAASAASSREAIESAECLIRLAVRFIDSRTGAFFEKSHPPHSVEIHAWHGRADGDDFEGVSMGDMLERLTAGAGRRAAQEHARPSPPDALHGPDAGLSQEWFWQRMARFLKEGDVIAADNGTSLSGVTGMALPAHTHVIGQALWGAVGYSLPATFGSMMAKPDRRHVLFIGDGSFPFTGQELSSILRHRLTPIIFLIINDGCAIERLILGEKASYNGIEPWRYASLCEVFAAGIAFESKRVTSVDELEHALEAANSTQKCLFVEVLMDRTDVPKSLRKIGSVYARQDYGSWLAPR